MQKNYPNIVVNLLFALMIIGYSSCMVNEAYAQGANEQAIGSKDSLERELEEAGSALVLGNWHLRMADGQERDGNFSLVIRKFGERWEIIHDHSSELKKPTE